MRESEVSRDKIKNLLIEIVQLEFFGDAQSDYTRELLEAVPRADF